MASNSPRRKQLLAMGGWDFKVVPAQIDESPLASETPKECALRLAKGKAYSASKELGKDGIVVAADTVVVENDKQSEQIMGKPRDAREAEEMLLRLRGATHKVYTALAFLHVRDNILLTDLCESEVTMRNYSNAEIIDYIATGDPLDKAGAYAIQHCLFRPVEKLVGCYANVMGLPLCHLSRSLMSLGLQTGVDLPTVCQSKLGYSCSVYSMVLCREL